MWRIELLGGLSARQSSGARGRTITRFQSRPTGLLLAYLAYHPQRSVPREELIELLWPECDPAAGRNRLSVALSSLRYQLEPPGSATGGSLPARAVLIADRHSVRLNPEAYTTDVAAFESLLQSASRPDTRTSRIERLQEAVELYRGDLLPGYFEEWCLLQRGALRERYLQALHQLVTELEQDRRLEQALSCAQRIIAADPLREDAYREVIRLSAALGQPSAALQQYRELERRLEEELGELPSAATRQLADKIRRSPGQPGTLPPAPGQHSVPHTTPRLNPRPSSGRPTPPLGTVTFLLTDIESSTALWERSGDVFRLALERHHALLREVFRRSGGVEVKEAGDGFLVAFERAVEALGCAVAGQRTLAAEAWPEEVGPLRVRMAMHTGDVVFENDEYHGLALHHASRMLGAAHGGQIVCSEITTGLLRRGGLGELEPGLQLIDMGAYRLRGVTALERLFQVNFPGMVRLKFPPLRAEPAYPSHLPLQFNRFFGREAELARLQELLGSATDGGYPPKAGEQTVVGSGEGPPTPDCRLSSAICRLVTLTGPGGTGKTRLALEIAAQLVPAYHGAVWFVPLEELTEPPQLIEAVLDGLHLEAVPGVSPMQRALQELSRQPTLLVLDNFEQLLPAGVSVIQELLEGAAGLNCLVTSRRTLNLAAEREFPLEMLATPAKADTLGAVASTESVQLFVDRAQVVRPDFQVTRANAAAVAELCRRLEGIPLALELAAARSQVLTPAQLVQQLQRQLDLLVSRRTGVSRHRTLRAAIDWSYRLLSPELQRFFAQLSVFRGGWSLEAAEAVTGAGDAERAHPPPGGTRPPRVGEGPDPGLALDYLMELRECSLLRAEASGSEMRFRMLESLQQYAAERRQELEGGSVQQRHADYFERWASERMAQLRTPAEAVALERFEADLDNVRSAADWAEGQANSEQCAEICLALGMFLQRRGFQREALRRIESGIKAVRRAGGKPPCLYARLLYERAGLHFDQLEYGEAYDQANEARALLAEFGSLGAVADADNLIGLAARGLGHFDEARRCHTAALRQFEQARDDMGTARMHSNLGLVEYTDPQGDPEAAEHHWRESLRFYLVIGYQRGVAEVLTNLGALAQKQDSLSRAWASYEEALQIERELRHPFGIGRALSNLGEVAELSGDSQQAYRLLAAAEAIFAELGSALQQYTADLLFRSASNLGYSETSIAEQRASLKGKSEDDLIRWALPEESAGS
jgi:predicted ATPase/DNA-binding SARP family transcriptional activator/class 3 adenylate cyclase